MTQVCRVCGCTNLSSCEGGCWWVEDDLCSTCDRAGAPELPPLRVADMEPLEALHCRAMHDLECGEQGLYYGIPVDHELEAHEPWSGSDRDGEIPWALMLAALRGRGLSIVEAAS